MAKDLAYPTGSEGDDQRPLPLIVADQWEFALASHFVDEVYWYSIRDWIAGLTGAKDPKRMWQSLRNSDEIKPLLQKVRVMDYGKYQSQFIDDRGLYRITLSLRVTKNRTLLPAIKDFLAKAGAFADLARRDPEGAQLALTQKRQRKFIAEGRAPDWIATRELGIVTRKQLMAIVYELLGTDEHMGAITNDTYRNVFGMTAQELRLHIGIPDSAVLRDHFSTLALVYTQAAEESCRLQLEQYDEDEIVAIEDVRAVVITLSRLVGKQVKEMAQMLGIDLVTGEPLLGSREEFYKVLGKAAQPRSKGNPIEE